MSKMQQMGVTNFVSEIRCLKGDPNFEKLAFLSWDMAPMTVGLKILQIK